MSNEIKDWVPSAPVGVEGFRFVDITSPGYEGWINLFWGEEVLALVRPPESAKIRAALAQLPAAVDEAMERLHACPKLWYSDLVGDQISQLRMRAIVTAALAQPQGEG